MASASESVSSPGIRAGASAGLAPVVHPVWLPREHGAYGQLAFPLATAVALGRPTVSALAISVAAVAAFLAHEPLLVVTGQRGRRALDVSGDRARLALWALGAAAALAGIGGLSVAATTARTAAIVPLVLAAACVFTVLKRRERTTLNEIVAAVTLCAMGLPVALAAGARIESAVAAWLAWGGTFAIATGAVRGLIARAKTHGTRTTAYATALAAPTITIAACAFAVRGVISPAVAAGMLPLTLVAIVVALRPPPPRHLREVGWAIIVACTATLAVLVATLR